MTSKKQHCEIGMIGLGVMGRNFLLDNSLLDTNLSHKVMEHLEDVRLVEPGVPVPGLMASLGYLDGYSSAWLPANLI